MKRHTAMMQFKNQSWGKETKLVPKSSKIEKSGTMGTLLDLLLIFNVSRIENNKLHLWKICELEFLKSKKYEKQQRKSIIRKNTYST